MSYLSSTMKASSSIDNNNSSGIKVKRKSRRHKTSTPSTASFLEETDRLIMERPKLNSEMPRERAHNRRISRDMNKNLSTENPESRKLKQSSSKRTTSRTGLQSKRQSRQPETLQEACIAARRALTSSASSMRPSNRETPQRRHRSKNNNNNSELDDEAEDFERISAGPESFAIPGHDEWLSGRSNNTSARVTLPSRASKYRNLSAGFNKKPRSRTKEHSDRPPSRQRHAFPTHLIDPNAFDAPETTSRRGGSSSSSSSASSRGDTPNGFSPPPERPPSRYMIKAKRHNKQGIVSGGGVSRRGLVDGFSCNQSHHDPKTDGFADVDESVPPPFRIKVTTDSKKTLPESRSPSASAAPRYSKRWPSFGNQEQFLRMAVKGSEGSRGSDHSISDLDAAKLQWFGKDDQINNAHLFETVISMPSPRPAVDADGEVAIEDDLEEENELQYRHRKLVGKQQEPQEIIEDHFPSRRAAVASKMTPTTSRTASDNQGLQWIRSSTNPFFDGSSSTVDYDSMDPELAIEQTPLYSSDDLMTLAATEMTDLHLDDYTALGDTSVPIAPPPSTSWGGSRLTQSSRSPPLRTSLGKDFLSLFAQH